MPPNTKKSYIDSLVYLSRYVKDKRNGGKYKPFKEITRDDFFATTDPKGFLENIKKEHDDDPKQKWIGHYKKRIGCYDAFWKYFTQPKIAREDRVLPPQLARPKLYPKKRMYYSVTQDQHWTYEEHVVFLRHCKDYRLRAFHAMHLEVGSRPGELLLVKVGQIKPYVTPKGHRLCDIHIGAKGKGRLDRENTIGDSIPYINKWLDHHPNKNDKNFDDAYLFPTQIRGSAYKASKPLEESSLRHLYKKVIQKDFQKLLDDNITDGRISPEDKAIIRQLQKKPCFPNLRRHESQTENALSMNDTVFNEHFGHSATSQARRHYVKMSSERANIEWKIRKGYIDREDTISPARKSLMPRYCLDCRTPNEDGDKFCQKCGAPISREEREKEKAEARKFTKEAEEREERTQKLLQDLSARQEEQEIALRGLIPFIFDDKGEFHGITEVGEEIFDVKGEVIGTIEKEERKLAKDLYYRNKEGKFMSLKEMYESLLKRSGRTEVATEK